MPFVIMGIACLAVYVSTTVLKRWGPPLLINETPSEPRGIYRLLAHPAQDFRRGMYVVFPVPDAVRELVHRRHWLRDGIPFLKEVAGLAGDEVCIDTHSVTVNGARLGPVFAVDQTGQPLPQRRGCFVVPTGCFFPASRYLANSFDGRYFGVISINQIIGEAVPVWTF